MPSNIFNYGYIMHNFTYYNPVKILFGAGSISKIKNQIPANSNVHYLHMAVINQTKWCLQALYGAINRM